MPSFPSTLNINTFRGHVWYAETCSWMLCAKKADTDLVAYLTHTTVRSFLFITISHDAGYKQ